MKKITEVCGFTDQKGKFWKTKEEAEKANIHYDIEKLRTKNHNFVSEFLYKSPWLYRSNNLRRQVEVENALVFMINKLLENPEKFIEAAKAKAEMEVLLAKRLKLEKRADENQPWWKIWLKI